MRPAILYIAIFLMICPLAKSQDPEIPDQQFLKALCEGGADKDADGCISSEEASLITRLDLNDRSIRDLTGIGRFTNLRVLKCDNNKLSDLNVGSLTSLTHLSCKNNNLTCLDVSAVDSLLSLHCGGNNLKSLDISKNRLLGRGVKSDTALDISNMPELMQVCIWWGMFYSYHPVIIKSGSPNVQTSIDCSPSVFCRDTAIANEYLRVKSSEDGIIFLVSETVPADLHQIQEQSIISCMVHAYEEAELSLGGILAGNYLLYAVDMAGTISSPAKLVVTGIEDGRKGDETVSFRIHRERDFTVYPNPASSSIRFEGKYRGRWDIQILAADGRIVYNDGIDMPGAEINLDEFIPGVYIFILKNNAMTFTGTFMKE